MESIAELLSALDNVSADGGGLAAAALQSLSSVLLLHDLSDARGRGVARRGRGGRMGGLVRYAEQEEDDGDGGTPTTDIVLSRVLKCLKVSGELLKRGVPGLYSELPLLCLRAMTACIQEDDEDAPRGPQGRGGSSLTLTAVHEGAHAMPPSARYAILARPDCLAALRDVIARSEDSETVDAALRLCVRVCVHGFSTSTLRARLVEHVLLHPPRMREGPAAGVHLRSCPHAEGDAGRAVAEYDACVRAHTHTHSHTHTGSAGEEASLAVHTRAAFQTAHLMLAASVDSVQHREDAALALMYVRVCVRVCDHLWAARPRPRTADSTPDPGNLATDVFSLPAVRAAAASLGLAEVCHALSADVHTHTHTHAHASRADAPSSDALCLRACDSVCVCAPACADAAPAAAYVCLSLLSRFASLCAGAFHVAQRASMQPEAVQHQVPAWPLSALAACVALRLHTRVAIAVLLASTLRLSPASRATGESQPARTDDAGSSAISASCSAGVDAAVSGATPADRVLPGGAAEEEQMTRATRGLQLCHVSQALRALQHLCEVSADAAAELTEEYGLVPLCGALLRGVATHRDVALSRRWGDAPDGTSGVPESARGGQDADSDVTRAQLTDEIKQLLQCLLRSARHEFVTS